jgi:integrase
VDDARKEASDLRREIDKGGDPAQDRIDEIEKAATEPTVKELLDAYLARHVMKVNGPDQKKNARDMVNRILVPKFGDRRVSALTAADVTDLHVAMAKTLYMANQVLTVLKAAFNKGIEWGMCTNNPARRVKRHPEDKRQTWLDETQLANLDRAITEYGQHSGELIRLLLLTGARRGEWMRARKEQFDLAHAIWTKPAHTVKEQKQEMVPLNAATMKVLGRVLASTPAKEPYLFPGKKKGEPRKTVRRPWMQILRAAGLVDEFVVAGKRGKPLRRWKPTIRLHDLRHSYASWLAENGVPLQKIGMLIGHQCRETTDRYAHIADKSLRDATNLYGNAITRLVQ